MKTQTIKIGSVGVDSGQLMICDPGYISSEFETPDSEGKSDHAHTIYKHKTDGKLWQFCYGDKSAYENVNIFPGSYADIIPEYGRSPNDLRSQGLFEETEMDPTPHIPEGEFSYRGISKITNSGKQGGQLNYLLGHEGAAVAFQSGMGDGHYNVFAEIIDTGKYGKRVKKVWVELITDEQLEEMRNETNINYN